MMGIVLRNLFFEQQLNPRNVVNRLEGAFDLV